MLREFWGSMPLGKDINLLISVVLYVYFGMPTLREYFTVSYGG